MRVFERGEKVGWLLGMTGFVYIIACYSLLYCWGTHGYGYRKKCVGVQGTCSSRILSSLRKYIVYIQWSTYSFSFPFFFFTLFPLFFQAHMNKSNWICASAYPLGISRQAPHTRMALSIARMGVFTAKEHSWNAFDASRAG